MKKSIKLKEKLRFYWRAWRYRWNLDPSEIAAMMQILRPGDVAVDVGSHKGAYTFWMAKRVGSQGHVYGFEPQIHLAERLWATLPALELNNVEIRHMGLSSKPGEMQLFIPGTGSSSPEATFEQPERYEAGFYQPVQVATLEQILKDEQRPIRLIKCDVEGHELDVFKGGESILRKHKPSLLFECEARHHPEGNMNRVFTYLEELGYQGSFFLGRKRLPLAQFKLEYQREGIKPYANNFLFQTKSS